MSSFGTVSRKQHPASTFGSKPKTAKQIKAAKLSSSLKKKGVGGRGSSNPFEKRNPPGYKKTSKLGEGGFGTVWDCTSEHTGRSFAVKQLVKGSTVEAKRNVKTGLNEQWFGRMWFSEGGKPRSRLGICEAMTPEEGNPGDEWLWDVNPSSYPGVKSIAKLVTTKDTSSDLWLVFEKCGLPLTELLWELKGSFHKSERIYTCRRRSFWNAMNADHAVLKKFLRHTIEAIELISSSNVVHSDLKPDNILVNYMRGETSFHSLKIIDFGSAYAFDDVKQVNSATPEYLPPEALALHCSKKIGHSIADVQKNLRNNSCPHAVDMWSLGCIFLEICAGFPLWFGYKSRVDTGFSGFLTGLFAVPGRSPEKIIARQIEVVSSLPNVLKRFPEIGLSDDENAIDLLRRMLELDPQHRISPADALQHPFLL